MSEKHLTESAWKSFITKEKFKDSAGFGKTLAAYEKLQENDFDGRLKELATIEKEIATLLKSKEVKAAEDVGEYLEEVEREIPKVRKTIEAAKKEAESDEEEGEEANGADAGAIKKKVTSYLTQIKSKGPDDKPLQFIAALGKGESGVMFGKSVGATQKKVILEMLPNMHSPKFVTGDCIWEENAHTFVVEKIPANFGKKMLKALMAETGVKWKVRVRSLSGTVIDADLEPEVAEEGDEATSAPAGQQAPPPAPPPPPSAEARAAFMERLKGLKPDLDKVIAANVAASGEAKTAFVEIGGLAKAGNFQGALEGLDRLEAVVQTGLQQVASPAQPAQGAQPEDPAAKFRERLAAFLPKVKEVVTSNPPLGGEIRTLVMEAGNQAKAAKYEQANALLERAEKMASGGGSTPVQPVQPEPQKAPGEAQSPEEAFIQKMMAMEADYLEAVKAAPGNTEAEALISRLKAIWSLAQSKAEAEAYPVSLKALEAIEKEDLFNKIKTARASGGGIEKGIVEKRAFLASRFQDIVPVLNSEVDKLRTAMASQMPEEDEDPDDLASGINAYLESFVSSIKDEIDDAIIAGDMKQVAGMRSRVEGDQMFKHLMGNPFVDGARFQAVVLDAISEIETKLVA